MPVSYYKINASKNLSEMRQYHINLHILPKKKRYLVYSLSHYEPHFSRTVLYPRVCSSLILYRNTWASVKSIHKQLYYPCGFQLVQGRHNASYPKHSLDQESCSFTSMSFVFPMKWQTQLSFFILLFRSPDVFLDTEQGYLAFLPVSNDLFMDLFLWHISPDSTQDTEKQRMKLRQMPLEHGKWNKGAGGSVSQSTSTNWASAIK